MINKKQSVKNQKGITLIEVLICVIIIAMVVGPLTMNFVTASKKREDAERVVDATNRAETLMQEVKDRINEDIILKQQVAGNRIAPLTDGEIKNRYDQFVKTYIDYGTVDTTSPLGTYEKDPVKLSDFLKYPSTGGTGTVTYEANATDYVEKKYIQEAGSAGNRFAYEVAILPIKTAQFKTISTTNYTAPEKSTEKQLVLDNDTLKAQGVLKLYTDDTYKFQSSEFTDMKSPLTFSANDFYLSAFSDGKEMYNPEYDEKLSHDESLVEYKIISRIKAKIDASGLATNTTDPAVLTSNKTQLGDVTSIKKDNTSSDVVGTIINIEGTTAPHDDKALTIVELDITGILRNATPVCSDFTFKIVNHTNNRILVKVIRNAVSGETSESLATKYHFVAANSDTNKEVAFEYDNDIRPEDNYLITIIVRELNPVLGSKGKIVKKMVGMYSYDQTIHERRW